MFDFSGFRGKVSLCTVAAFLAMGIAACSAEPSGLKGSSAEIVTSPKSGTPADEEGVTDFSGAGVYVSGFEVSVFCPDGQDELWWVRWHQHFFDKVWADIPKPANNDQAALQAYAVAREEATEEVIRAGRMEVKGKLRGSPEVTSEQVGWGHLGQYPRELSVEAKVSFDSDAQDDIDACWQKVLR